MRLIVERKLALGERAPQRRLDPLPLLQRSLHGCDPDRDLRQLRNLTEGLRAEVRNPTISADGNTIAFESNARGQWDILIYTRSGQPLGGIDTEPR